MKIKNDEMIGLLILGESFASLGRFYGISRQRVKQIADQHGFKYQVKTDERICPVCEKSFKRTAKQITDKQNTCGHKCASSLRITPRSKASRHGPSITLHCAGCGKEFKRSGFNHYMSRFNRRNKKSNKNYCTAGCHLRNDHPKRRVA